MSSGFVLLIIMLIIGGPLNPAFASDSNPVDLTLTKPLLKQLSTSARNGVFVGDELLVTTTIRNNEDDNDQTIVVILEARDSSGATEMLEWQEVKVEARSLVEAGVSWIPKEPTEYELRTFAISGFDNPRILSPIISSNVSLKANYPLVVGNRTFDALYSFSSGGGIIQNMELDVSQQAIIVDTRVDRDTTLEISFPFKMLELLETESGFRYCIGNGFAVFVNGTPSEYYSNTGALDIEQTLHIPINLGTNKVEIIGLDLLQIQPSCVTFGLQFTFVKDLPVEVKSWYDALAIAREYLDVLAKSNEGGENVHTNGPVGSMKLIYVDNSNKAFLVNRYDGSIEDEYPNFNSNMATKNTYFWIATLNHEQDVKRPEYEFVIDAQTGKVVDFFSV